MNDAELAQLLDEARRRHGVVGAALGMYQAGRVRIAAAGLLNLETGVEATPESVFQIGSIGKLFTTALSMQLVAEGRLALDTPVVQQLPEFSVADPAATRGITPRQLLTHTSGLAGDFFPADDPQGPSAASYLRKMRLLPQLFAPGSGAFSYCNSGFVVAGRLVETLRGQRWSQAVLQRIAEPLGLRQVVAAAHQSLRYCCAMGHLRAADDSSRLVPAPETYLPRSMAAAGTVLNLSVGDLLRFASALMQGHPALLARDTAQQMRQPQIELPAHSHAEFTHWGLGWGLDETAGVCGHDGETLGQFAYLRCHPAEDFAFALLSNSPSRALFDDLAGQLLPRGQDRAATREAAAPAAWAPERYTGEYRQLDAVYSISAVDGGLVLRFDGGATGIEATLIPLAADVFEIRSPHPDFSGKILFSGNHAQARANYLRKGLRLFRRTPTE